MLVNNQGEPLHSVERLAPDESYSVPIDIVAQCGVRLQPDRKFISAYHLLCENQPCYRGLWLQMVSAYPLGRLDVKKKFHVDMSPCWLQRGAIPHSSLCTSERPRRGTAARPLAPGTFNSNLNYHRYTKANLRLCAPLEIENLLPYNLDYRIYDKDTNQTWMSYLRKGGVMPVHSVELGHLLLLNVTVQDTGNIVRRCASLIWHLVVFKPSDFTIINPGNSEYDVENHLLLQDSPGRQLRLRLNYL